MDAITTGGEIDPRRGGPNAAAPALSPAPKLAAKPDGGLINRIGCKVSEVVADLSATPLAQIAVVVVCGAWFALGYAANILTAILSILAITLTQMVLNKQNDREADAHRRDVALHAKIDELVHASRRARDEIAGIETLEEEEIERLRDAASQGAVRAAQGAAQP